MIRTPNDSLQHQPRGLFTAWARFVTARPWATLAVVALLTVAAMLAALRLEPATGVQDMLADDQPAAVAFGKVLGHYALVDDLIVLVRLPEAEAGADPERLIAFAERLEAQLAGDPMVASVQYRPSAQAAAFIQEVVIPHGLYYLDDAQQAALLRRLTPEAMDQQFAQNAAMLAAPGPAAGRLAKQLINDPLRLRDFLAKSAGRFSSGASTAMFMDGVDAMVSRDGRAIMLRIAGVKSANDLPFTAAFMPRIREAVNAANTQASPAAGNTPGGQSTSQATSQNTFATSGGTSGETSEGASGGGSGGALRVDYTGAYAIAELSASQTRADMIRSCVGSVVLLVVLFLVVYRNPLAIWLLKIPVFVAIVWAFGLYAGVSGRLTPVTAVAGAVLAGLGIDYCVHFLSHHQAERQADGGRGVAGEGIAPAEKLADRERASRSGLNTASPNTTRPAGGVALASGGQDRAAAIRTTAAIGPAIMAACVTSLIGFGAVLSSSVRSLREFALLGMLGLGMALLAAVTVLPALLAALGPTRLAKRGLSETRVNIAPLVATVARHPGKFLAASALMVAATGAVVVLGSHRSTGWQNPVVFDDDLHALHPQPHPPLDTQNTLSEVFGAASNSLMILVEADQPAEMLRLAEAVQQRFSAPGLPFDVAGVIGPATLLPASTQAGLDLPPLEIKTIHKNLRAAADQHGFNPDAFAGYEDFLATLLDRHAGPSFADAWNYPSLAGLVLPKNVAEPTQGLVLVTLAQPWKTMRDRNQTIDAVRAVLAPESLSAESSKAEKIPGAQALPGAEVFPQREGQGASSGELPGGLPGEFPRGFRGDSGKFPGAGVATLTGISVIGYDTQLAIGGNLTKLLLIAGGLVLLWLGVFFRRAGDLVLATLPAATALLVLLACAVVFGWTLNAINLIALPLVVGIGVDDGIFLVSIWRRDRRSHADKQQMIEHLAASAHAVCMTTLTTGLAFGSLTLTSVPAIRSLGMFTAVGVTAALLASLLGLVPALVGLYREGGEGLEDGGKAAHR